MKRWLLYYILLMVLLPATAQTRITADGSMKELGRNSHFTLRERKRFTDLKGLRKSEYTGHHHSLGAYVYGGYASVISNSSVITTKPGGYNLRIGGIYEYRYGYFTVQTGLGIMYRTLTTHLNDYRYTNHQMAADWDERWNTIADTWGMSIDLLTYDINGRTDHLQQLYAQVPILLGMNYYGMYFLAGLTPSVPLWQKATTRMTITSRGSYDRYYGLGNEGYWEEMDNHGYRKDVPFSRSLKHIPFRLELLLSLEAGYDFHIGKQSHLRLAAFADCALNNLSGKTDNRSLYIPFETKWDFETFEANPVWYSDVANGKQVHAWSAGIKLTLLYTFKQPDKCILCSQKYGKKTRRR